MSAKLPFAPLIVSTLASMLALAPAAATAQAGGGAAAIGMWKTETRDGRVSQNDIVVLEAMGGGFTWGAAVIRF